MFQQLEMAPADPIMGLSAAFKSNANPNKINLSVGVYQDASGQTPVLASVQTAQERVLAAEKTKSYLSIEGSAEYGAAVRELILGVGHEAAERAITVQSPGGTGALRLAGDFLAQHLGDRPIWISEPTWANHPKIFASAGLQVETYPYFDAGANSIDADALLAALGQIPSGHVVLLHGCCHNPTGCDPTPDTWRQIAEVVAERGLLPLVDFAYQGFGDGLDEDATGLRTICDTGCELLVASSFSKNFGLYNERVGALTLIGADADAAARALSHLKIAARTSYSNPPAHGAAMVRENPRRRSAAPPMGRRIGQDARADQSRPPSARRSAQRTGRGARLFVYRAAAGDVLVFGLERRAGRGAAGTVRDLHRRGRAHQRRRPDRGQPRLLLRRGGRGLVGAIRESPLLHGKTQGAHQYRGAGEDLRLARQSAAVVVHHGLWPT